MYDTSAIHLVGGAHQPMPSSQSVEQYHPYVLALFMICNVAMVSISELHCIRIIVAATGCDT